MYDVRFLIKPAGTAHTCEEEIFYAKRPEGKNGWNPARIKSAWIKSSEAAICCMTKVRNF
jgi:hypothetical protein